MITYEVKKLGLMGFLWNFSWIVMSLRPHCVASFQQSNQGEIDLLFQEIEIYYCDGDEYFGKHWKKVSGLTTQSSNAWWPYYLNPYLLACHCDNRIGNQVSVDHYQMLSIICQQFFKRLILNRFSFHQMFSHLTKTECVLDMLKLREEWD